MSLADRTSRYVLKTAGIVNIAGGLAVLCGYFFGISVLLNVFSGLPPMKPNTALCLVLIGIALLIPARGASKRQAALARACLVASAMLALLALIENASGIDLHIDGWVASTAHMDPASRRLPPSAGISILLLSLGLLCMEFTAPPFVLGQIMVLLAGLVPLAVIVGYFYSITMMNQFISYTLMAIHTALLLLLLSAGALLRHPRESFVSVFFDETPDAELSRRILPAVILVPLLIAAVVLQLVRINLLRPEQTAAANLYANILALAGLATWASYQLRRVNRTRRSAEENASQERQWLKVTLASIGDGVIATDNNMLVTFLNPIAERLTGWSLLDAAGKRVDEIFKLIDEESLNPIPSPVRAALDSGGIAGLERPVLLIARNGAQRPVDNSAAPIRSTSGEISGAVLIFHDATQRRKHEAELLRSEQRFRATFEQAAVGFGLAAPDGKFLRVNQRLCDMVGYTCEELESMNYRQITHPDDIPLDDAQTNRLLSGELETFAIEKRYIRKDGSIFWINLTVSLSHNPSGNVEFFIGVIEDITRRKTAEEELARAHAETEQRVRDRTAELAAASEALRVSGERTRLILDSAYEAFIAMDSAGFIADCNSQTEPVFGWKREELLGKHLAAVLIPPALRDAHNSGLRRFLDTGQSEILNRPTEFMAIHRDGREIPIELTVTAVKTTGGWLFAAFIRDISKRKEMQDALEREREFLNAVLDQAEAGIITCDDKGNILTVNRMMREIHGDTGENATPVRWSPYFDLYHADGKTPVNPADAPLFRALRGESVRNLELVTKPKGRPPRHMVVNARAITGPKQTRLGAVLAVHDITEQKIAEKMLRESLMEKVVLLKEIHHRVKNNLQIVSSLLSLQATVLQDQKIVKLFQESQNRVRSMALIHEMLYQSNDLAKLDFAAYVNNLINSLFQSYGAASRRVTSAIAIPDSRMDIDTAVPCGLIITELVSNSLKYAFPDNRGGIVQVNFSRSGENATLRVSDDGIGLPPNFDLQSTPSLGLQLVQRLARQLGGKVEREQTESGTAFRVNY